MEPSRYLPYLGNEMETVSYREVSGADQRWRQMLSFVRSSYHGIPTSTWSRYLRPSTLSARLPTNETPLQLISPFPLPLRPVRFDSRRVLYHHCYGEGLYLEYRPSCLQPSAFGLLVRVPAEKVSPDSDNRSTCQSD